MKASFTQTLFKYRAGIGALWALVLLIFADPWISLYSVLLFLPGLGLRFWAAGFIGPTSRKPVISTDRLNTRGPYSIFRHPLYIANALLVAAALALLRTHWILTLITCVGFVVLYVLIGRGEERKLTEKYGDEYTEFKKRVTPFFPLKFEGPLFKGFNARWALREYNTWLTVAGLYLAAFLAARVCPVLIQLISGSGGEIINFSAIKAVIKAFLILFG